MNASVLTKVSFSDAKKVSFKNYANFKGRSRRSEYWKFMLLVNILTSFFLFLLLFFLFVKCKKVYSIDYYYNGEIYKDYYYSYNWEASLAFSIIFCFYISFITLPVLAATARRLHDVGEPGEFMLVVLVPIFGTITLIVYLCKDSVVEPNIYGKSPKYIQLDNYNSIDMRPLNPIINSEP